MNCFAHHPVKAVQVYNQVDFDLQLPVHIYQMNWQEPYATMAVSFSNKMSGLLLPSLIQIGIIFMIILLTRLHDCTISSLSWHFKNQIFYKDIHQAGNNIFDNVYLILTGKWHNSNAKVTTI